MQANIVRNYLAVCTTNTYLPLLTQIKPIGVKIACRGKGMKRFALHQSRTMQPLSGVLT